MKMTKCHSRAPTSYYGSEPDGLRRISDRASRLRRPRILNGDCLRGPAGSLGSPVHFDSIRFD